MKYNIKPFDVSILSSYMGKWLTAVLAVFVIAVTISALNSGNSKHNIVSICVTTDGLDEDAFEPLRSLVAGQTRRAATVSRCNGRPQGDWDLWVASTLDFFRYENELGLEALCEIVASEGVDRAVLVSRPGDAAELSSLSAADITFAGPASINGFLVQLSMLAAEGFAVPETASQFRFDGDGGGAARIVLGVVHGASRLGACRQSDVTTLIRNGVIAQEEIAVLRRERVLPENIIACRREDAGYYRAKLRAVRRVLQEANRESGRGSGRRVMAQLLKASGVTDLRPVDSGRVEDARELCQRYAGLFGRVEE